MIILLVDEGKDIGTVKNKITEEGLLADQLLPASDHLSFVVFTQFKTDQLIPLVRQDNPNLSSDPANFKS